MGLLAQRGPVLPFPLDGPAYRMTRHLTALALPRRRTDPVEMAAAVHALVMQLWQQANSARTSSQRPAEQAMDALLAAPTSYAGGAA